MNIILVGHWCRYSNSTAASCSFTLWLFFLFTLLICSLLNLDSVSFASARAGICRARIQIQVFWFLQSLLGLHCYLWLWKAKCMRCLLPLDCLRLPNICSLPRCKRGGLRKSPASGMSLVAPSCFKKSRTSSAFNFWALLAYFRTFQKYTVLLQFIEISLLMLLYFLCGT